MKTLIHILIIFCLVVPDVWAFRCKGRYGRIATEGMSKYEILKDCGNPKYQEVVEINEKRSKSGRHRSIRFKENFIYEKEIYGRK